MSFCHGLTLAGHRVFVQELYTGRSPEEYEFGRSRKEITYPQPCTIYAFFGLAWGMGRWSDLCLAMRKVIASQARKEVYEETAEHFVHRPPWTSRDLHWIL